MIFSSLVPTLIKVYLKNIYLYTNEMKLNEGTLFYKNVNGWKHTVPVLFYRNWSRSRWKNYPGQKLEPVKNGPAPEHCRAVCSCTLWMCDNLPILSGSKPSSQPRLIYIYRFKYVSVIYVPVFASRVMYPHRYRYSAAYWIDIFAAVLRSRCRSEPAYFGCSWRRYEGPAPASA